LPGLAQLAAGSWVGAWCLWRAACLAACGGLVGTRADGIGTRAGTNTDPKKDRMC
jgi:hypothetical protein